ncbi:putative formin-like protein 6 isoform X2 [Iris pallida]|uniref:Formin-like protein 6 isoform X2 n=1 Tax=Iris pallida TaxID=29817 RepID=A0AAX6DK25_IRIPA|nr:putative formin-like protein 6 isoform X2 [Iris pallida]
MSSPAHRALLVPLRSARTGLRSSPPIQPEFGSLVFPTSNAGGSHAHDPPPRPAQPRSSRRIFPCRAIPKPSPRTGERPQWSLPPLPGTLVGSSANSSVRSTALTVPADSLTAILRG